MEPASKNDTSNRVLSLYDDALDAFDKVGGVFSKIVRRQSGK